MSLFDEFRITPGNRFAHAACRAVAEAPTRAYNPLWMYGASQDRLKLLAAVSEALSQSQARFVVWSDVLPGVNVAELVADGVQVVVSTADAPAAAVRPHGCEIALYVAVAQQRM